MKITLPGDTTPTAVRRIGDLANVVPGTFWQSPTSGLVFAVTSVRRFGRRFGAIVKLDGPGSATVSQYDLQEQRYFSLAS